MITQYSYALPLRPSTLYQMISVQFSGGEPVQISNDSAISKKSAQS